MADDNKQSYNIMEQTMDERYRRGEYRAHRLELECGE